MDGVIASLFFILALVVRFAFFPYWASLSLGGDESYYWNMARLISEGDVVPQNIFLRPPLWPYVLSVSALFSPNPLWGRLLTTILGAVTTPFIYFIGKRVFSKRVGILAAFLFTIYPSCIGFSHYLWSETFYLLFSVIITYLFFGALNSKSVSKLYMSFAFMGLAFLSKEETILFFASCLIVLLRMNGKASYRLVLYAILIFSTPAIIYSVYASYTNHRVIILADAPFYNANQRNYGFSKAWQLSPEENQKLFVGDMGSTIKNAFRTYPKQFANLWTPNSFVIHRLLYASYFGNYRMPYAEIGAYIDAGAYIIIVVLGLSGMFLSEKSPFETFSTCYVVLLCLSATIFLMCSRFRIPLMYLFIIHASRVISYPKQNAYFIMNLRSNWKSVVLWTVSLLVFGIVIVSKWDTLGQWG
jgi:4-amino-4-deoxy-L-arabinose transferase-like glycosyltransferase